MFFIALRQIQFFISLPTLNQALFSYQFKTLKLHAFSLPTSHQTAPDHTLEHFFTTMFDTMNSSSIKMVAYKFPCNPRVFLSTYFSTSSKIALQVSFLGSSKSIPHKQGFLLNCYVSKREALNLILRQ